MVAAVRSISTMVARLHGGDEALLPLLDQMTSGGLATVERVEVRRYGPRQRPAP